ncbi:MAG: glycoside hydrolase family 2 protein [Kiritimatiellia bacterium]
MKRVFCTVLAAAFTLAGVADLDLNGSWQFRFDEGRPITEVTGPAFDATGLMVVPGCFDAMPRTFMKRGTAMYRRTFRLDEAKPAAWLVVDGIGLYGRFWIDGREIGVDDLPYSRVELPVGALAAGVHTLVAAVDNRFDWSYQKLVRPYYDFHLWGGFYRGVSLTFDNRRLFVRTRDYATGTVEIEAVNFAEKDFATTLVFDDANEVAATFRNGRARVAVPSFRLWSPEEPNLHTVAAKGVRARFGIRTIEAKEGGLYLNGRRIFLKGANRHEQQLQLGASTPEGLMLIDLQNLKAMGGNFLRGAHYPQSQRFLDLCDEMGVLVWEESLGWGNGQTYTFKRTDGNNELVDPQFIAKQIEQTALMVRNSFNHPSVIIFAFLNECRSDSVECKALVDRLIATIKAEDSGRLVTFACNLIAKDICNENTDIVAFNTYPGTINGHPGVHGELVEKIHNMPGYGIDWAVRHFQAKHPGKTLIISEMGTSALYGARDPSAPADTENFQAEYDGIVAEAVWNNPGLAGISFWQYFDTRTCGRECAGDGRKHLAMSWAGLFDANRRPKLAVQTLADWYTNKTPANLKDVK